MLNAWVCPRVPAGNTDAARLAYAAGIKRCMDAIPLWVAAARLEEGAGNVAKARALLEQVRRSASPAQHARLTQPVLAWPPALRQLRDHTIALGPRPLPPPPPRTNKEKPTPNHLTSPPNPNFCLLIQIHVRLNYAALLPCRRG